MSIVAGLFRQVAPGLIDNLEAQGLFKGVSRSTPSLTPEMFIGGEGISNLGKQGLVDANALTATMAKAEEDWFNIPSEEWNKLYGSSGLAIDPVAGKAMLEISDKNVAVQKGVDLNTLPENEFLGFDEVFKADTLKKAYPSMADIKVGFVDDPASPRLAAFDPASDSILFNRQHPEWRSKGNDPVKVALHEVQHYVQGRELFTGGESFTGVLQASQPYQESLKQLDSLVATSTKEVMRFAKDNKKLGFTLDNVQDAITALVKRDGLSVDTALTKAFAGRKNLAETMLVAAQEYPQLAQIINAKQMNSDALKQAQADYMRVAGETFARQTEQRRGMSADERMAMPAMRAINTDPTNKKFGINTENLTSPTMATQAPPQQDAFIASSWDLKEQTPQERKEGLAVKLKNPIKLDDGSRLSGFTSNSQNVFYGYDKNGEIFTIGKEYLNPETIVGSRDSDKTANKIKERLLAFRGTEEFTDPFAMQVPQSTIPEGM